MTKKHALIVSIIGIGILAIGGWFLSTRPQAEQSSPTTQHSTDSTTFAGEYTKVGQDNRFVYATPQQVLEVFQSGSGLVFLGFPECPWCQQLAPIVNEAAKLENLDTIYYLNIRQARQQNDATYQALLEKLKGHLNTDEQGKPRIYVPDVTALVDGKIVGHFLQETTADGEEATPDTYWTEERRSRAIEQLRQMIRQIRPIHAIKQAMQAGALLLDVRTEQEFTAGHVAGAVNLPIEKIRNGHVPDRDKSQTVYVYGRSGNRSSQAVTLLKKAGFITVKDLGGLEDVKKLGATIS